MIQRFVSSIFTGGSNTSLKTNLISIYKLDETSGLMAYDSYGSNNGVNNGCTINQTGILDKSYLFSSSYINIDEFVTGNSDYDFTGDFSVSAWFKLNSLGAIQAIFDNGSGGSGYFMRVHSDNKLAAGEYSGGWNIVYSTTTLTTGVWYNAVFVFEKGTGIRLYINGSFENSSTQSGDIAYNRVTTIGARYYLSAYGFYLDGYLDQVAVWDKALSLVEIDQLYNGGNGLAYDNW